MKRVFLTIITALLLSQAGYSQSNAEKTTTPTGVESSSPQTASTQKAALDEASHLSQAVVSLYKEGKYDEALSVAKRALKIRETALGPEHESVVITLINIGELYTAKKIYGDGIAPLTRALAIKEKQSQPDNLTISMILSKLAYMYYMNRENDKAESFYQRAISTKEKASGPDDLEVAKLLLTLADVYRLTGKPKLAEQTYERSIVIYSKKLGLDDPVFKHAYDRYSCLYAETGQYDKSKELGERLRRTLGLSSDTVAEGVLNGKAISLPKPEYPGEARAAGAQGSVVIRIKIDETGKVIEASDMCGGHPLLVGPSIKAAREARFTPTLLEGKPVKVTGLITYNFVAQ